MFQFLFKYPSPVFTKGRFVLLGTWPAWLLPVLIVAGAGGLAVLIGWRLRGAAGIQNALGPRNWRAWVVWGLQSAMLALVLLMLWQPAMMVGELSSRQNIIAVVVDNSRSMSIADSDGKTREAAAIQALEGGVLSGLRERFQTRLYLLGNKLAPVDGPQAIVPTETATHIDDGLKQLVADTSDLPVGAVVLLTDGANNTA